MPSLAVCTSILTLATFIDAAILQVPGHFSTSHHFSGRDGVEDNVKVTSKVFQPSVEIKSTGLDEFGDKNDTDISKDSSNKKSAVNGLSEPRTDNSTGNNIINMESLKNIPVENDVLNQDESSVSPNRTHLLDTIRGDNTDQVNIRLSNRAKRERVTCRSELERELCPWAYRRIRVPARNQYVQEAYCLQDHVTLGHNSLIECHPKFGRRTVHGERVRISVGCVAVMPCVVRVN